MALLQNLSVSAMHFGFTGMCVCLCCFLCVGVFGFGVVGWCFFVVGCFCVVCVWCGVFLYVCLCAVCLCVLSECACAAVPHTLLL